MILKLLFKCDLYNKSDMTCLKALLNCFFSVINSDSEVSVGSYNLLSFGFSKLNCLFIMKLILYFNIDSYRLF